MKLLILSLSLPLLMTACGGTNTTTTRQDNLAANAASPMPSVKDSETPAAATPATSPSATTGGKSPVEFTYLGVAPDKEHIRYRIKVSTDKPVSQVDLGMKYTDDGGKVVDETTYAWQNIVKSVRKPIESGKSYDVEEELPEGATRAEVTLKRVIFADGTRWDAQ